LWNKIIKNGKKRKAKTYKNSKNALQMKKNNIEGVKIIAVGCVSRKNAVASNNRNLTSL